MIQRKFIQIFLNQKIINKILETALQKKIHINYYIDINNQIYIKS
jgi:hypothetical protein